MKRKLLPRFPKGSVKPFVIALVIFFVINIIFTGILRNKVRQVNNAIYAIDAQYYANLTHNSDLYRQRQELLRRDRIIDYAQSKLGMELLKPDVIASGQVIKEVREEQIRHGQTYAFVDFITPTATIFERAR